MKVIAEFCPVHILSLSSLSPLSLPTTLSFLMVVGLSFKMKFKFKRRIHLKICSLACIYKNNFPQLELEHMFHICGNAIVQHAISEYHTKAKS